jgi:hypothetical protein
MSVSILVAGLGIGTAILVGRCKKAEPEELTMEPTMASIEEVRPKGEMYVCSALIEDCYIKRATEKRLLLPNKDHACVQTMRQKCSYIINLDKVEYTADEGRKTVRVKLPQIEYVASTQSSSFLSDDSNYWAEHLPNTNAMKQKVEEQIKQRFDTPNNRRQAERYAEDAISEVMKKLGYETEFETTLTKTVN